MNLLYISNISGNKFSGPNYSIPSQIYAQSKVDRVYWLDLSNHAALYDEQQLCHHLSDISGPVPTCLPAPFHRPDLVIFEEFYRFRHPIETIVHRLIQKRIPYIIIPRSQMTRQGRAQKRIKKWICGVLFYDHFVRKSAFIQYLTAAEKRDSEIYQHPSLIIPNGICLPSLVPQRAYKEPKVITYIGRLTKWQKGLDLLLEACSQIQDTLREKHVVVRCYGPEQGDAVPWMKSYCRENHLTDIVQIPGPVYDKEKTDVLAKSDLFIMTSRFEGMPMGLLEAMAYGLPCIITPGTNMQHEIVTAGAGFGCEENPSSIAKTILQAVQAGTQLVQMSNAAVQVAARYSWDEIAERTHVVYEQLLADLKNSESR